MPRGGSPVAVAAIAMLAALAGCQSAGQGPTAGNASDRAAGPVPVTGPVTRPVPAGIGRVTAPAPEPPARGRPAPAPDPLLAGRPASAVPASPEHAAAPVVPAAPRRAKGDALPAREQASAPARPPRLVVESGVPLDASAPARAMLQDPVEALRDLPLDRLGRVDWMAALASGAIAPRTRVDGSGPMETRDDVVVMRRTRSMPWVHFPHRAHTEWLACSNCHPSPFAATAGASSYTMDDMYRGKGCGLCHDRVAFSTFACERCHVEPHEGSPRAWW